MKHLKYTLASLFSFFLFCSCLYAETIKVENDSDSTYVPTTIINGSFDTEPWMNYKYNDVIIDHCEHTAILRDAQEVYFNGVNGGWNTTETYVWNGNLFEYSSDNLGIHNITYNNMMPPTDRYVEMNGSHSALLYQDLSTQGNDVILWRLSHGVTTSKGADTIQNMRVEIGAPNMNDDAIVNAHGMNNEINPEIVLSTKAIYRSTGVTNSDGDESTLGYAGSDIGNLSLHKVNNADKWYKASGIYIVPDGQEVTRFGFIAEAITANYGNLLDDIEFSTLIGNLNAEYNNDKSATVTGYWGEIDPSKKLVIKIGTKTYELDMSDIEGNFKFVISKEMIGTEKYIEVYHEDFPQVKKEVEIVIGKLTQKSSGNATNITITSDEETIINSLDEETITKVNHGEDIEISVDINNITKTIEKEEKDIFVKNLNKYTLGDIYSVSLYKKLDSDEESKQVTKLSEPLEFVIELPENLINKDANREYKIMNYYNGKVEIINVEYNEKLNTLTFKTDKLSKFAIVYEDTVIPDTRDSHIAYIVIGTIGILGLIGTALYTKKKLVK